MFWNLFRICFVSFVLIYPSFFVLVNKREIWPFSHYPMYSFPEKHTEGEGFELYAVGKNGAEVLFQNLEAFFPLGPHCLGRCLGHMGIESYPVVLNYYAERCHENPASCGLETKENLQGIRLYSVKRAYNKEKFIMEFSDKRLLKEIKR